MEALVCGTTIRACVIKRHTTISRHDASAQARNQDTDSDMQLYLT